MSTFVRASVGTGAMTLEGRWYRSAEVFALERERIFGREWICVGREEQFAAPGDFIVAEIAGESLIIVRQPHSAGGAALRAFYNVCRHRGTRICERDKGHFTGSIQCPYHAWTYALDGTLKVARNMAEVSGFRTDDFPLHEAPLALWEGFVFVTLSSRPEPFEVTYAPLLGRFSDWNIGALRTGGSVEYDVACNWKLIFQNYSECYHCPLVHPQLDKLSPSDSGRNDLMEGRFLGGYSELRRHGASLTTSGATDRPALGSVHGEALDRVYYYTVFPTLLLSLHPDYVMVHYLRPVAVDRTQMTCSWLFDPKTMECDDFNPSDAIEFWDLTNRQDWHVSELTQKGVESRAYSPGPYANAEGLLAAFDRNYLRAMEDVR
jgi:glycine betaine catabolism A